MWIHYDNLDGIMGDYSNVASDAYLFEDTLLQLGIVEIYVSSLKYRNKGNIQKLFNRNRDVLNLILPLLFRLQILFLEKAKENSAKSLTHRIDIINFVKHFLNSTTDTQS